MARGRNYCLKLCGCVAVVALATPPAAAEDALRGTTTQSDGQTATINPQQDRDSRQLELRGIEDTIGASEEQRRQIEAEIETLRNDRARLVAALLATTEKVNAAEKEINESEAHLATLTGSEDAIRRSLESRRGVIAEVLASLQRMGRTPPPALLVRPEDMLQAICTSMLLGAILPEMRAETEALASDLADLVHLRRSIASERDSLAKEAADLGRERQRLSALIDARQAALGTAEQALGAERERAQELARQASSLKDLIGRMDTELAGAARAAEAARKADEARKTAELEQGAKPNATPFKDAARLAPAIAFADAKGLLPLPAVGAALKTFGTPDGFGRDGKRIIHRHADTRRRRFPQRWLGGLCRSLSNLWTTLDHQCRPGLLYRLGRYGTDQRRGWAIRPRGRTRRRNGRWCRQDCRSNSYWSSATDPLCRIS